MKSTATLFIVGTQKCNIKVQFDIALKTGNPAKLHSPFLKYLSSCWKYVFFFFMWWLGCPYIYSILLHLHLHRCLLFLHHLRVCFPQRSALDASANLPLKIFNKYKISNHAHLCMSATGMCTWQLELEVFICLLQ